MNRISAPQPDPDAPQPDTAAQQPDPDTAAPGAAPGTRARWRSPLVVTLGLLLLLALGAFVAVQLLNQGRTAQATAQDYFDALAAGDASAANALTVGGGPSARDAPFLTDAVLAAATERISGVTVLPADDPMDTFDQRVIVSYSLAGEEYEEEFTLRLGEPEWGVLRTWQLPRPVTSKLIFLVNGPGTLTLSGLPVNPDSVAGRAELFPAVYPLGVVESAWVGLAAGDESVVVAPGLDAPGYTLVPTDALTAEVQRQMDEFLEACVAQLFYPLRNEDTGCGFRAYLTEPGMPHGSWELLDYPVASPLLGGSVYAYTGGDARFTPDDGGESATSWRGLDNARFVRVTEDAVSLTVAPPMG